MHRVSELSHNCIIVLFMLYVGAKGEQCQDGQCGPIVDADETSFMQLSMQPQERSKASTSADGPGHAEREAARKAWLEKKAQERTEIVKKKHGIGRVQEEGKPRVGGPSLPFEEEETDELYSNPFTKTKFQLAEECPEFADQPSCDEAVWLAGLMAKFPQAKENNVIQEASDLLSVQSWFESPAGPSGFYNWLDRDHSGGLDAKELEEYGGAGLLQLMDVDGDSAASRHEVRIFLRGMAVLFKILPPKDSMLKFLPPVMTMKLADSVTLTNTVPIGPYDNPFTEVAKTLKDNCPLAGNQAACDEGVHLTSFLETVTSGTPQALKLVEAGTLMGLWLWFENPHGPAGFFSSVDNDHQGSITASKLMSYTHSTNPKVVQLLDFMDSNKDGKVSRYEAQTYLRSCALLMHHLPMLDLPQADTSIEGMFGMADSVVQQAVSGSGPVAWCISMSCSFMMIVAILYVHCWPSKKKGQEPVADDTKKHPLHDRSSSSQSLTEGDEDDIMKAEDSMADDTMSESPEWSEQDTSSLPYRMGSTFRCKADCAPGACLCSHTPVSPVPRIENFPLDGLKKTTEPKGESSFEDEAETKESAKSGA